MSWPGVITAYRPYLDVADVDRVTLLEGDTPLIPTPRLASALGLPYCDLRVKYEGLNPTGSFKDRSGSTRGYPPCASSRRGGPAS